MNMNDFPDPKIPDSLNDPMDGLPLDVNGIDRDRLKRLRLKAWNVIETAIDAGSIVAAIYVDRLPDPDTK